MENINTNAGALPSNAGDDFHLLWAAQKLLELLNPDSILTAVTVEGPAWEDSIITDLDDSNLYSIDLAEYYEGVNFQSASQVVFSQLKYSTYRGDEEWTASRLCQSNNKQGNNSIIRRFADTYQEYMEKFPDCQEKLIISLVSNRPTSNKLQQSLIEAKETLNFKQYKQTGWLLKNLTPKSKVEIEKIYNESNLSSKDFINFIQILNFDDCGVGIRSIQKAEIIQQLDNWAIANVKNKFNEIIMTLRELMTPGRNNLSITKEFVSSVIGGNYNRFFPAPAKILSLKKNHIERESVSDLSDIIMEKGKSPICVHAIAGFGKTTLVNNIEKYLPDGSAVVFYDCYGGGSYLQPSESRYEYDTAITQICNSLAYKCKSNFLLERNLKESEFFSELYIRLEQAVKYVKSLSRDAVLLLIIDAADNAVYAASQNQKSCFIDKLLQQNLPEGVKLLLTYRTEHKDYFSFPASSAFYQVPPFNLTESSEFLRSFYPEASEEECFEFHKLSKGIPRVQTYVLNLRLKSLSEQIDMLRPNSKNTEDLFKDMLEEIKQRYGENNKEISSIFGILSSLPRPIPITIASRILNCSVDMLNSLSIDCSQAFYTKNEYIYFQDEDFETFLRDNYCDNIDAVNVLAEYMYKNRNENAYCAKHLHNFLIQQGNISNLLKISLEETVDESLVDIREVDIIMLSRIKATLKMPVIKKEEYWKEFFQLIYKIYI